MSQTLSVEIPIQYLDRISSYSVKLGLSEDSLRNELLVLFSEVKPQSSSVDLAWKKSFNKLNAKYRTKFNLTKITGSVNFQGFFIGGSDAKDYIQMMRDKALRMYKSDEGTALNGDDKGPYVMIMEGSQDVIPLDRRETIGFQKKLNHKFGKPLD